MGKKDFLKFKIPKELLRAKTRSGVLPTKRHRDKTKYNRKIKPPETS